MDDDFNDTKKDNKPNNENDFTLDIKNTIREMKREFSEQMRGLKEDIEDIKEDIRSDPGIRKHRPPKRPRKRRSDFSLHMDEDWGERFGASIENYVGGLLDSVGDAIDRSVGSIFQPYPSRRHRHKPRHRKEKAFVSEEDLEDFYDKGSAIMAALSDSNRLRMLKELEKQPLRQSDLSEKTNTKGGNFKHHITILKDEGLVRQEGVRERYMLTFAGREALKLVEFLYASGKKRLQVPVIIDDAEEEE
jgi:DNA-binding transcriptional ArsR family regulator